MTQILPRPSPGVFSRLFTIISSLAFAGFAAAQVPTVSLTATDAAASEAGANPATFRLTRTGVTTGPLTVRVRLRGSATQGADYTFDVGTVGDTIVFPAGAGVLDVVAQPIDDAAFDEGAEDIKLEVRSPLAGEYIVGADFAAEAAITDNDVTPEPPVLTAEPWASGWEAGPLPATFIIVREGTANVALNVLYSITGTATSGVDYVAQTGSITMPSGVMSLNVSVPVLNDNLVEAAETLVFTILPTNVPITDPRPPQAYQLDLQNSATVTIVSDDAAAVLNVAAFDDNATETGATPAIFRIQRSGGTGGALNVRYSLAGTATAGSDYTAVSGTVVLPVGAFSVDVPVHAIDDTEIEGAETIIFNLLPTTAAAQTMEAYSLGVNTTATATLVNNDYPPPPIVVITTPENRVAEVGKPFPITFDGSDGDGHIVSYTVAYPGTLQTFSTGYTTPPAPGTVFSGSVNVTFSTRSINNVTITARDNSGNTATATRSVYVIAAQPPPPPPPPPQPVLPVINVFALDAEAAESSGAPNTAKFRVTHDFPTTNPVYFLAYVGGTAHSSDYTLSTTPSIVGPWFQIPAGHSEIIIEVTPVDDALIEHPESVTLGLYSPPFNGFTEGGGNFFEPGAFGFYYGANTDASIVIQDNEVVPPHFGWVSIATTDFTATETPDNSDPAVFTLTRVGETTHPLTVRYTLTTPPTTYPLQFPLTAMATNGVDYQSLVALESHIGTVTFPIGASTAQIVVNPIYDTDVEPLETVQVTLLPSTLPHQTVGSYGIERSIAAIARIFSFTGTPALPVVSMQTTVRRVGRRHFIRDSSGIRDARPLVASVQMVRSAANLSQPLTVYYSVSGSAVNGVDYDFLPGFVTFPAGVSHMNTLISSRPATIPQPQRVGVGITIIPPPSGPATYLIAVKRTGSLSIRAETFATTVPIPVAPLAVIPDPQPQSPAFERMADGGAVITMATPAGDKLYRVERTTDLVNWETLDTIQSEGGEVEYYDPAAAGMDKCFYRLVEVPAL